jgi:hypothetical protein
MLLGLSAEYQVYGYLRVVLGSLGRTTHCAPRWQGAGEGRGGDLVNVIQLECVAVDVKIGLGVGAPEPDAGHIVRQGGLLLRVKSTCHITNLLNFFDFS